MLASVKGARAGEARVRIVPFATTTAIQQMVDFLVSDKKLTRHEAYQLVSIAGNVAVTQLVDKPNVGVHVRLPKSIFVARPGRPGA